MASQTITGNHASFSITVDGYTLTNLGTVGSYTVTYGVTASGAADTVVNAGRIIGLVDGVYADQGLSVTNQSGGRINAPENVGVAIYGAPGGVTNFGTITGNQGIELDAGGYVSNQSSGTITALRFEAVGVYGGAGTVTNAGKIAAYGGSGGAIALYFGGIVTNLGTGSIICSLSSGVLIQGGAGSVINAGSIYGGYAGVSLANGGTVTNQAGGTIAGGSYGIRIAGAPGTVDNASFIGGAYGIALEAGGTVINQYGGTIAGSSGLAIDIAGGTGTVINNGYVGGTASGIALEDGGSVTNQASGRIAGSPVSVEIENAAGSVSNAGYIGGGHVGVSLAAGGSVTNLAGGYIYADTVAVQIDVGAGTVTNAGYLYGSDYAVRFAAGFTNRLIVDPGGSFYGALDGGNAIGSAAVSTLELASATTTGTLANLGTFTDFADVTIDRGATWIISGTGAAGTTLVNAGTIASTLTLGAGALVTNQAAGTIAGTADGIDLTHGGTVTNQDAGTISSSPTGLGIDVAGAAGTVVNAGLISGGNVGVNLLAGGSVTNQSTGTIASAPGGVIGIAIIGAAATISNAGTVIGARDGIYVDHGLDFTNQSTGAVAGTIVGASRFGIYVYGGIGTLTNAGGITGGSDGVVLAHGGSVTNQGGGSISSGAGGTFGISVGAGTATVSNAGTITGRLSGIYLLDGGTVTNQVGGSIVGTLRDGIQVQSGAATVVNDGTISGALDAVSLAAGFANRVVIDGSDTFAGTVDGGNAIGAAVVSTLELASAASAGTLSGLGTQFVDFANIAVDSGATWDIADAIASGITVINAGSIDAPVTLDAGAVLTNASGGTIGGPANVAAVTGAGAATVVNAGDIAGSSHGISLGAGGTVTNQAGGTISGAYAVGIAGAPGTVTNAGSIDGTTDAVSFSPGFANRLIIDAGAAFSGTVDGGNTLGAAAVSTLELASGAFVGTFTGLGTQFVDFADIAVDSGARWDITDTIGAGITLINAGTLASEVALGGGGTLTNVSGGTIAGAALASAVAGVGPGPATVINAGLISGTHYGVTLGSGGIVNNQAGGTISGIANDGVAISGGAGTVINAGLIADGTDAVSFAPGYANRLVIDPGATFSGTVDGGNTIGATVVSTLELASGASTGVLSGLGTQFVDFSNVTIDSGAAWSLDSAIGTGITLTNSGIVGTTVTLDAGAALTNTSGGVIGGVGDVYAVYGATDGPATVVNAGALTGAATGIFASAGGFVTNQGNGSIAGGPLTGGEGGHGTGVGVQIAGGAGTVVNAGHIFGLGNSVLLSAGYANRLVIDPGAVFSGVASGGNAIGGGVISTLELAAGASAGSLSDFGSQYIDFAAISIDSGAAWTLTGSNDFAAGVTLTDAGNLTAANLMGGLAATIEASATLDVQGAISPGETIAFDGATGLLTLGSPGSVNGAVTGFVAGDTIDLAGVDPGSVHLSSGVLDFTAGGIPGSFDLMAGGDAIAAVTDNNGGALVTALCFCAGTRIRTPSGEVAIEKLSVGDLVLTASGAAKPLVWIGTGQIMVARGHRSAATPVIVRKGALSDNVPNRDLRVTKGHSLLIDGVLIPVEFLVNHRTILWDDHAREVTIYHLELASHDVLVANGAPAESYRDDGNRWLFRNANTGWGQSQKLPCAPVLTGGSVVDAAWRRLLDRAGTRAGVPLTEDPGLHLLVNGARMNPTLRSGRRYLFRRVRAGSKIRVVSRAGSPAELALARDPRMLGVAIRQIRLWRGVRVQVMDAADPALRDGFHAYETDNGFRWTNGDALLPAALFSGLDGACDLELLVASTARYALLAAAA